MFQLLFSNRCLHCGTFKTNRTSYALCPICLNDLKQSKWTTSTLDILRQRFPDAARITDHYSLYPYTESSIIHDIIHAIKYNGHKSLAYNLGLELGYALRNELNWNIDLILPVPLHPFRQMQRGFNQSYVLAEGLSKHLSRPIDDHLVRIKSTKSQTKLNREERLSNLKNSFRLKAGTLANLQGKKILLVDDVVTTGSTITEVLRTLPLKDVSNIYSCSICISMQ